MDFIIKHWSVISLVFVFICGGTAYVLNFLKLSQAERYEQIRGWLLQAVITAERTFGAKTGKLKLSNVYSEFCAQLPWLAKIISFGTFSSYVDDALAEMKSLIAENSAISNLVQN